MQCQSCWLARPAAAGTGSLTQNQRPVGASILWQQVQQELHLGIQESSDVMARRQALHCTQPSAQSFFAPSGRMHHAGSEQKVLDRCRLARVTVQHCEAIYCLAHLPMGSCWIKCVCPVSRTCMLLAAKVGMHQDWAHRYDCRKNLHWVKRFQRWQQILLMRSLQMVASNQVNFALQQQQQCCSSWKRWCIQASVSQRPYTLSSKSC